MAFRECCHVMSDGMKCKSPALKRQSYCYFHHRYNQRQRRRIQLGGPVGTNQNTGIEMPLVESWETIQIGIQEVVEAIVDDRISTKRAGLMLYALQLASTNLKMMNIPGISQPTGVTELPEETDTPDRVPDGAPHLPQSADVGTADLYVQLIATPCGHRRNAFARAAQRRNSQPPRRKSWVTRHDHASASADETEFFAYLLRHSDGSDFRYSTRSAFS